MEFYLVAPAPAAPSGKHDTLASGIHSLAAAHAPGKEEAGLDE
jgi:hypothetical protein